MWRVIDAERHTPWRRRRHKCRDRPAARLGPLEPPGTDLASYATAAALAVHHAYRRALSHQMHHGPLAPQAAYLTSRWPETQSPHLTHVQPAWSVAGDPCETSCRAILQCQKRHPGYAHASTTQSQTDSVLHRSKRRSMVRLDLLVCRPCSCVRLMQIAHIAAQSPKQAILVTLSLTRTEICFTPEHSGSYKNKRTLREPRSLSRSPASMTRSTTSPCSSLHATAGRLSEHPDDVRAQQYRTLHPQAAHGRKLDAHECLPSTAVGPAGRPWVKLPRLFTKKKRKKPQPTCDRRGAANPHHDTACTRSTGLSAFFLTQTRHASAFAHPPPCCAQHRQGKIRYCA